MCVSLRVPGSLCLDQMPVHSDHKDIELSFAYLWFGSLFYFFVSCGTGYTGVV